MPRTRSPPYHAACQPLAKQHAKKLSVSGADALPLTNGVAVADASCRGEQHACGAGMSGSGGWRICPNFS